MELLTAKEVSEKLGVSYATIMKYSGAGKLRSHDKGKRKGYVLEEVREDLAELGVGKKGKPAPEPAADQEEGTEPSCPPAIRMTIKEAIEAAERAFKSELKEKITTYMETNEPDSDLAALINVYSSSGPVFEHVTSELLS